MKRQRNAAIKDKEHIEKDVFVQISEIELKKLNEKADLYDSLTTGVNGVFLRKNKIIE